MIITMLNMIVTYQVYNDSVTMEQTITESQSNFCVKELLYEPDEWK